MAGKLNRVVSALLLSGLLAVMTGCSQTPLVQPTAPAQVAQSAQPNSQEDTHSITISCPIWSASDPFQKRREELYSKSGVQVKFVYSAVRQDNSEYLTNAVAGVNAGKYVDAYLLMSWQVKTYADQFKMPELSQGIAEKAIDLKKFYDEQEISGPFYGLPISFQYSKHGRYAIAVTKNLVDKYNPKIESIEDYFSFLKLIKEKEPDYVPGVIDPYFSMETILTDSGYVDASYLLHISGGNSGVYCKPEDPLHTLAYAEDIPQVVSTIKKIKQLQIENTLVSFDNIGTAKYATLAMGLCKVSVDCYAADSPMTNQVWDMVLFPVEQNLMSSAMTKEVLGTLVLSPSTQKKEDVLKFANWLMTDRTNYQQAYYGVQGSEYEIKDTKILPVLKNSNSFFNSGLSAYLGLPAYDQTTVTQPVNTMEAISTKGLSNDAISEYINLFPQKYLQLCDECNKKLDEEPYASVISARKTAFGSIISGNLKDTDVDAELEKLNGDQALLDVYKNFITTILDRK